MRLLLDRTDHHCLLQCAEALTNAKRQRCIGCESCRSARESVEMVILRAFARGADETPRGASPMRPCPHCGASVGETVIGCEPSRIYRIGCGNGECPVQPGVNRTTREAAVRDWNLEAGW